MVDLKFQLIVYKINKILFINKEINSFFYLEEATLLVFSMF